MKKIYYGKDQQEGLNFLLGKTITSFSKHDDELTLETDEYKFRFFH